MHFVTASWSNPSGPRGWVFSMLLAVLASLSSLR